MSDEPLVPPVNPHNGTRIPDDVYVEEQRQDLLVVLSALLPLFSDVEHDQHTSLGRLRGALEFLEQELRADRFPLPGTKDMIPTINHLAFESSLPEDFQDISQELQNIVSLVICMGVIKPRHDMRIIEIIDTCVASLQKILNLDDSLTPAEVENLESLLGELKDIGRRLHSDDTFRLPISREDYPAFFKFDVRLRVATENKDFYIAEKALDYPLATNWRPYETQTAPGWSLPDWI